MVPEYMMQIDKIPVTINGKVDKRALPEIELKSEKEYVAPSDYLETMLAGLYEEVLNIERVGIEDDFFELGGNSIKGIRLISKALEKGYTFTMRDLMINHSIKSLKPYIKKKVEEESNVTEEVAATKVMTRNEEEEYILSLIDDYDSNTANRKIKYEYEMSTMQQMFYTSNNISIKECINLHNKYTLKHVQDALKRMIRDYDVLRYVVNSENDNLITEYEYNNDWNIPTYIANEDTYINSNDFYSILSELLNEKDRFIHGKALAKMFLYVSNNGDIQLNLFVHHMIWDAMSMDVFRSQFNVYLEDENYKLPKDQNYKSYVNEIIQNSNNDSMKALLQYEDIRILLNNINEFITKLDTRRKLINVAFSIRVSKKVIDFYEENPINTMLYILSKTIFKDIELESLPMLLLYHGRLGTSNDYSSTLGLFLDLIPMSFHKENSIRNMDVQKNIDSILKIRNKEKIHFMTMFNNDKVEGSKILDEKSKKGVNNVDIDMIPCINFLGMFNINKNSKEEYFEVRKEQDNFMFAADYSDEMLHFSISCYEDSKDTIVDDFKNVINEIEYDIK